MQIIASKGVDSLFGLLYDQIQEFIANIQLYNSNSIVMYSIYKQNQTSENKKRERNQRRLSKKRTELRDRLCEMSRKRLTLALRVAPLKEEPHAS